MSAKRTQSSIVDKDEDDLTKRNKLDSEEDDNEIKDAFSDDDFSDGSFSDDMSGFYGEENDESNHFSDDDDNDDDSKKQPIEKTRLPGNKTSRLITNVTEEAAGLELDLDRDLVTSLQENLESVPEELDEYTKKKLLQDLRRKREKERRLRRMCHKTHLLLWLAHGSFRNKVSNSPLLKDMMKSIFQEISTENIDATKEDQKAKCTILLNFFCNHFTMETEKKIQPEEIDLTKDEAEIQKEAKKYENQRECADRASEQYQQQEVLSYQQKLEYKIQEIVFKLSTRSLPFDNYIHCFVALCRSFRLDTRLVIHFRPLSLSTAKTKRKNDVSNYSNAWAEVYIESEKRYIVVDVLGNELDNPKRITQRSEGDMDYVVAYYSNGGVCDVTARYSKDFHKAKRLPRTWWPSTLQIMKCSSHEDIEKAERKEMETNFMKQEMPNSISGFKNHLLYMLERHLLKNQVIYPPDSKPAGFFKGEKIFPRHLVKLFKTKQQWLKQAVSIKENEEEPFRISEQKKRNGEIENVALYGEWQTEPFRRLVAKDGIVPLNDFGNVELFKPEMIPVGCVHLRLPDCGKIAKELNISYGPALVEFQFVKGNMVPRVDGIVVCQEFVEVLTQAWFENEAKLIDKACETREQRVISRWRRLTRRLLFRKDLMDQHKAQYDI